MPGTPVCLAEFTLFHLWAPVPTSAQDSGSVTKTASQMPLLKSEALGSKGLM